MRNIFDAKRVPLTFLNRLTEYREFHRPDFAAVKAGVVLKEFDFYFDYILGIWLRLKALGDI